MAQWVKYLALLLLWLSLLLWHRFNPWPQNLHATGTGKKNFKFGEVACAIKGLPTS